MSLTFRTETFVPTIAKATIETDSRQSEPLNHMRLERAKKAYTTRFLAADLESNPEGYTLTYGTDVVPVVGDVVLARVEQIGMHTRLESPASRRQTLFVGDEILIAYGNRYATDQFMAEVPPDLEDCHLVAAGGVAGLVTAQHANVLDPTVIRPLGLMADRTGILNLKRRSPRSVMTPVSRIKARPPVIAVLGTTMNSGKTTTVACLAKGLSNAGLLVAAGKATGTGSGNDPRLFTDAGASPVLDFTDFGLPTTFRQSGAQTRDLLVSLVAALAEAAPDVIVVEIADGLYQDETRLLLRDPVFHETVDRVLFCATDALGATAGTHVLRAAGLHVAAVSGRLTASPLAIGEAAEVLDVQVLETHALCDPSVALTLMPGVEVQETRRQ